MRNLMPLMLAPALLLAACGDSDQQAQQNQDGNSAERRSGQQVATNPNPPASVPERPAGQGTPAQPSREPATTGSIPGSGAASQAGNLPASPPGIGAAPLAGRRFATASGTIAFGADNSFTWRDQAGKTMTGRYVQEAERISFNSAQSGEGGSGVPMTCRYRMDGPNKFVVEDSGTTCPVFKGLTFDAQG